MTFPKILTLAIVLGGFASTVSAKEFRFPLDRTGENNDGNYSSVTLNKGFEGTMIYELVPATKEVTAALKAKNCPDGVRVDASVLGRTLEIDHENRGPGTETVKLLVRQLDCVAR